MHQPMIVSKRVGYSNVTLLVNGSNSVLTDTGVRGGLRQCINLIKQAGLTPRDVKLIVLTHTHYDHAGNLNALQKYTGAKVMVHKNEFKDLQNGFTPIPDGMGSLTGFISRLGRAIIPRFASPKPFIADLINENEFDLSPFGIDGRVIHTPGHTMGSQSVITGKTIISGDTFINMKSGVNFPHFANDPELLLKTWENIFEMDLEEIYPGHGPKMPVEKVALLI